MAKTTSKTEQKKQDERKKRLETLKADLNREFGEGVVKFANDPSLKICKISSGSLTLDRALGGGFPLGRSVLLWGDFATAKTLTALKTIASAQKEGMLCGLIEPEKSLDTEWATRLGVDCDELIINRPEYGEKAMDVIYQMLKSDMFGVIVVDSIAALLPKAEMKKLAEEVSVAELARIMSKALRKLTAANDNTLLIFINQVREKVGVMFGSPKTQPGGRAMDFFASQKIQFSLADKIKEKRIDFDPVKMKNVEREMVVGNYIQAVIEKDKTQALMRKALFAFSYDLGDIDRTEEVLGLAMHDHLITKTGNSFVLNGDKFVGRKRIKNHLDMHPEVMGELIAKIEAKTRTIGEEVPDVSSIMDEEEIGEDVVE